MPPRPAGFCTGCPERPIFSALTLAQETLGQHHISCDIGCHLFSILPPFNLGATTMGYGLGASSAAAFNVPAAKRPISIMGDGGFWHNGRLGHRQRRVQQVRRRHRHRRQLLRVGHRRQDILSSRAENPDRSTNNPIDRAVRGVGVQWVRTLDRTYDVAKVRATIEEALTTDVKGPRSSSRSPSAC